MITQQQLIQLLEYNPDTGVFRWKVSTNNRVKVGDLAGVGPVKGYGRISIAGRRYVAHRLAWLYTYGVWPTELDHINGDKSDNRLTNLREVTHQENARNHPLSPRNRSGIAGVYLLPSNKWQVSVGKTYLGTYDNLLDAAAARKSAELKHGFHTNHGRR